jgi:hypothetical protein
MASSGSVNDGIAAGGATAAGGPITGGVGLNPEKSKLLKSKSSNPLKFILPIPPNPPPPNPPPIPVSIRSSGSIS